MYRLATDAIRLDDRGCWSMAIRPIAYPGAHGLVFRSYFVLISNAILPRVKQYLEGHEGWMTRTQVRNFGVIELAYHEIET
jgi:hypothetical protein